LEDTTEDKERTTISEFSGPENHDMRATMEEPSPDSSRENDNSRDADGDPEAIARMSPSTERRIAGNPPR